MRIQTRISADPGTNRRCCTVLQYGRCMNGFDIEITQTFYDFDLANYTQCKNIPVLAYNGGVPGPMMHSQT